MSLVQEDRAAVPKLPVIHRDDAGKPIPPWPRPVEIRRLPREVQEEILAVSAALAEHEYHTNKDLTDFEAFAEEP